MKRLSDQQVKSELQKIAEFDKNAKRASVIFAIASKISKQNLPLVDKIVSFLTHDRVRSIKPHPDAIKRLRHAVSYAVSKDLPVDFIYPSGGYKHWLSFSFPFPNFGEVLFLYYLMILHTALEQIYSPSFKVKLVLDIPDVVSKIVFVDLALLRKYHMGLRKLTEHYDVKFLVVEEADRYLDSLVGFDADNEDSFVKKSPSWEKYLH